MASLRARLIAGLLALAAVGLLVLAGVTYVEQRGFLLRAGRPAGARGAVRRALRAERRRLRAARRRQLAAGRRSWSGPPARRAADRGAQPPAGTYGAAAHARTGPSRTTSCSSTATRPSTRIPTCPRPCPLEKLFTVDGDERRRRPLPRLRRERPGGRHRRRGRAAPRGRPHAEPAAARSWGSSSLGVLAILGAVAWMVVRIGLLPLDRMGHTAGAIAGGDLSHRVEATDPRTEVGRLGHLARTRCSTGSSRRSPSARRARSACGASWPTPRTSCARRSRRSAATPSCSASAPREEPEDTEKAMRRIEEEAQRMGVLVEDLLLLARLDEVQEAEREQVDLAALAADAVDDARATAPDRDIELELDGDARRSPASRTGCARCSRNLLRNALVHTPPGTPIEVTVDARARRRAARGARPRARAADRPARAPLRALLARRGRPRARPRRRGPGPGDRRRDRRRARRRVSAGNAPDGGAVFAVALPAAGVRGRATGPVATRRRLTQSPLSRSRPSSDGRRRRCWHERRAHGHRRRTGRPACPAPAGRARRPRSTSSSRSTTSRRSSSTRSAGCTGSSPPSCPSPGGSSSPTTRAPTPRRRSPPAGPRAAGRPASLRLEEKGRGRALRAAWSASPAQVVCYMDVDLSTDLRGLLPLVAPLLSGHSDLAIGTRLAHGARVVRGPKRELISRGVQHDPPHGPARPLQRRAVRLQGGAHERAARAHRRRARRGLVLRHRAARARPAARAAHPRGARRLGRRPRLARGHRPDRVGRPARRRAARRGRRDRAVPRSSASCRRSPTRCSSCSCAARSAPAARTSRRSRSRRSATPRPTGATRSASAGARAWPRTTSAVRSCSSSRSA